MILDGVIHFVRGITLNLLEAFTFGCNSFGLKFSLSGGWFEFYHLMSRFSSFQCFSLTDMCTSLYQSQTGAGG